MPPSIILDTADTLHISDRPEPCRRCGYRAKVIHTMGPPRCATVVCKRCLAAGPSVVFSPCERRPHLMAELLAVIGWNLPCLEDTP